MNVRTTALTLSALVFIQVSGGNFSSAQSLFGISVAAMGDVNGDQVPDYAVGGYAHPGQEFRGAVWMFSGADDSVLYALHGDRDGDCFGYRVAPVGDVDGDEVVDLLVVASPYGFSYDRKDEGYGRVYSGAGGALLYAVEGVYWFHWFSSAACPVGDVNGDERNDFAVLAWPRYKEDRKLEPGRAVMVSGADGSTLWSVEATVDGDTERVPSSIASGSDVDGDGVPDLIVGEISFTPDVQGTVRVLSGTSGTPLREIEGGSSWFGASVAFLPDIDGDGSDEIAITTKMVSERGSVTVYSGAEAVLYRIDGPEVERRGQPGEYGHSIKASGNLDGDGVDDFLVSDPKWGAFVGAVHAYSGRTGKELFLVTGKENGMGSDWRFGISFAVVGDVNGDGRDDFVVGCATQSTIPGYVRLVSGRDGATLRTLRRPEPKKK